MKGREFFVIVFVQTLSVFCYISGKTLAFSFCLANFALSLAPTGFVGGR